MGKDHPPGHGLENPRDHDVHAAVHVPAAILDHDHSAVVQVAHALADLLALLDDLDRHLLAGQDHRLDRVSQLVDVEHLHALQLGHAVEIEVVGQDGGLGLLSHYHQLAVHISGALGLHVHDADRHLRLLLELVQHVKPSATAIAAERIRRVGDVLQLLQDELRDDQLAKDEASLADIGDAAIDDRAGVHQDRRPRLLIAVALPGTPLARLASAAYERQQFVLTGDAQLHEDPAEENEHANGQQPPEVARQLRQRAVGDDGDDAGRDQPDQSGHQIAGGGPAQHAPASHERFDGDVGEDHRPDHRAQDRGNQPVGVDLTVPQRRV